VDAFVSAISKPESEASSAEEELKKDKVHKIPKRTKQASQQIQHRKQSAQSK